MSDETGGRAPHGPGCAVDVSVADRRDPDRASDAPGAGKSKESLLRTVETEIRGARP